jgi:hypothetical protein
MSRKRLAVSANLSDYAWNLKGLAFISTTGETAGGGPGCFLLSLATNLIGQLSPANMTA